MTLGKIGLDLAHIFMLLVALINFSNYGALPAWLLGDDAAIGGARSVPSTKGAENV